MNDREIDRALGHTPPVDPALLERISRRILPNVTATRPLPAARVLALRLLAGAALIAVGGAALFKFHAIHRLALWQAALIFPLVMVLVSLAINAAIAAMIPGSRRAVAPLPLILLACAALVGIFALVFPDYSTERFVPQGIACLSAGLMVALPAGWIAWLILRRGFAVDTGVAGAAIGALAGLAGVLMLELHCAIFEAPHVMLWHTAVIPVSAVAGWLIGKSRAASS